MLIIKNLTKQKAIIEKSISMIYLNIDAQFSADFKNTCRIQICQIEKLKKKKFFWGGYKIANFFDMIKWEI